ncbi:MAG: FAD-dependent oxidoreductase [Candidatus Omnitrophica bacterium]|nr:FAD-dependent oxidoreductase [Candidatus Omnitrophota bacterium]
METKYLIIGNSIAGVSCIEGIRSIDNVGKIVVVSKEDIQNYSRPLISYYLAGKISENSMAFRSAEFYKENSIELILNVTALSIDTKNNTLITNTGNIRFEKLLIASGGSPIVPNIQGYSKDIQGIFTFTSFSEAKKLKKYVEEEKIDNAVILGGGLIGLKCAEGLLEHNIKIHMVELSDRLLSSTLDKDASNFIETVLMEKGCVVYKNDTIESIYSENNKISKVKLKSGKEIETKLLVIAVGVKPETSFVKDTGIQCNRGILVDQFMKTNISNIFAAGDVAEGKNLITEKSSLIAIWPVAARQGKIAGINMAGGSAVYEGMFPMNAVEIAGVPVISFGITAVDNLENYEILKKSDGKTYKKIVLHNNKIVGSIFLGKIERSGIYAGLIKNQINVAEFKSFLLEEDFGLLILPEKYRKHIVVGDGIEV